MGTKYLSIPLPVRVGWAWFLGSLAFRILDGFGLALAGFDLDGFGWLWLAFTSWILDGLELDFALSLSFTKICIS